jgi:hypothetical protein
MTQATALYRLLDAWERHRAYPDTFHLPDPREVARLRPGSFAKIGAEFDPAPEPGTAAGTEIADGVNTERFWTLVTEVAEVEGAPLYRGRIDNDLVYTERHGLTYGDVVTFGRRHILDLDLG